MNNAVAPSTFNAPTTCGTVKWFAPLQGYGFVTVTGFEEDFLLHQTVLQKFGRTTIAEGSKVGFAYDATGNGYRITEITCVEIASGEEVKDDQPQPDFVSDHRVPARVKWYDPAKGYGFVNEFGSSQDIFIGSSVLQRSSRSALLSGEAICIQVAETAGRKSVFAVHDWA